VSSLRAESGEEEGIGREREREGEDRDGEGERDRGGVENSGFANAEKLGFANWHCGREHGKMRSSAEEGGGDCVGGEGGGQWAAQQKAATLYVEKVEKRKWLPVARSLLRRIG